MDSKSLPVVIGIVLVAMVGGLVYLGSRRGQSYVAPAPAAPATTTIATSTSSSTSTAQVSTSTTGKP